MDASNHFEVAERTAASELGAHGMVADGPGEVATEGGGSTGARAGAACARDATDDATVDSGGGTGAAVAHVASSTTAGIAEACGDDTPAAPAPTGGPKKRRRARSTDHTHTARNRRKTTVLNSKHGATVAAAEPEEGRTLEDT